MRKILIGLAALLAGCSTPAYRAPEVPVPTVYRVGTNTSSASGMVGASRTENASSTGVYVSTTLASTPFWTDLGDSTLAMLVREGQRANMISESPGHA